MEVREFKAKTVDEAITAATLELGISSDQLEYKVIDEGSKGFLGIFNTKPAVISVTVKKSLLERTQEFCDELFAAMKVETTVNIDFREEEISITFILVAAIFIGQQVYEGIAVQNNISNIAHIVGGIVGAIIVYGLNVKAKYGLYR